MNFISLNLPRSEIQAFWWRPLPKDSDEWVVIHQEVFELLAKVVGWEEVHHVVVHAVKQGSKLILMLFFPLESFGVFDILKLQSIEVASGPKADGPVDLVKVGTSPLESSMPL